MSSPFQRTFSSKSPLNHVTKPAHNPDPKHIHNLDNSDAMKNEAGETQSELLTKRMNSVNDYSNNVEKALRKGGFVNDEDEVVFPDQDRLDRYKARNSELVNNMNVSSDSIDAVNMPNEAKRLTQLKSLDDVINN